MRRKHGWVNGLTGYAVGVFICATTFPAAFYLHVNARQWEAPAIFISLGLGLIPAIWYFRTKRYGWLVGTSSGLLLGFSMMCAILHGWESQVVALVMASAGALFVAVFAFGWRVTRRTESALRALGDELNGNPHLRGGTLFRDDGARITVYPNRRSLLVQCAFQGTLLAVIGAIAWLMRGSVSIVLVAFCFVFALLALSFLAMLSRLLIRRPTLVVGPDGIFDHGSLFGTGTGLLRWDEILDVSPLVRPAGFVTHRYLALLVSDIRTIRTRQSLWKRGALRFTALAPSTLTIWQGMLDVPITDLVVRISDYAEAHAPPGWYARDGEDDDRQP